MSTYNFEKFLSIPTGGGGFRYKYGIHIGFDVAVAPDNTAFYIQVGSAWARS